MLSEKRFKEIKAQIAHLVIDIDFFEESLSQIPRYPSDIATALRREGMQNALEDIVFNSNMKKFDSKKFVQSLFGPVNNFKVFELLGKKLPQWQKQIRDLRQEVIRKREES